MPCGPVIWDRQMACWPFLTHPTFLLVRFRGCRGINRYSSAHSSSPCAFLMSRCKWPTLSGAAGEFGLSLATVTAYVWLLGFALSLSGGTHPRASIARRALPLRAASGPIERDSRSVKYSQGANTSRNVAT
jgi:hypothetical protein